MSKPFSITNPVALGLPHEDLNTSCLELKEVDHIWAPKHRRILIMSALRRALQVKRGSLTGSKARFRLAETSDNQKNWKQTGPGKR